MTHELNQSQFSRLSGVSRQAVSKAIRDKLITKNENGKIDITEAKNALYLSRSNHKKPKEDVILKPRPKKKKEPAPPPESKPEPPKKKTPAPVTETHILTIKEPEREPGTLDKEEVDILKKQEDIETARIKNDTSRKKLVSREPLIDLFGFLQTVDKQEIVPLAGAFVDACAAAFGETDKKKIHRMEQRLTTDIYKALAHKKRLIDDYIKDELAADAED